MNRNHLKATSIKPNLVRPEVLCPVCLCVYLFLAVLGLHGHEDVSPVAASGDCSLVAGLAVLIVVASLVVEHRL